MDNTVYEVNLGDNLGSVFCKFDSSLSKGDNVIVVYGKCLRYGKIITVCDAKNDVKYEVIDRIASEADTDAYYVNLRDADKALRKCRELTEKMELNMSVIDAEFSFDRAELLINFTADERVDFRELAKKLASLFHARIELHQIGARDKAKRVGGLGVCGQELCCVRFLKQIDSISMNRAKNQNLALNPSKINGCCGRLLCCLLYEDETYTDARKGLLVPGKSIKVGKDVGKIVSVDVLSRTYKVLINDQKIEVKADDLDDSKK